MKPTILFPVFNKAAFVERGLRSCLAQTEPSEIIIFGPENTDGTDSILSQILDADSSGFKNGHEGVHVARDIGGHRVHWFRTPVNGYAGMNAGMNADFNWIMRPKGHPEGWQVSGDFCLFTSADDVMAPNRVERVKWAFETFNPSWVVNKQLLMREDGTVVGEGPGMPDMYSRHINMTEGIKYQIGSSGGFAWATDLYAKFGPINHIESNDVILPTCALAERGMYYIDEPLQTMYLHDDINNLGLEGQVRGARSPQEAIQIKENMAFQGAANWTGAMRRLQQAYPGRQFPIEFINALHEKVFSYASFWADQRAQLTMGKIKPLAFGAKVLGLE